MLLSAKLAPTFDYPVMEQFWRAADELGFHSVANYDHFYGLTDNSDPTLEGLDVTCRHGRGGAAGAGELHGQRVSPTAIQRCWRRWQ